MSAIEREHAVVVDVPNTRVRAIEYFYLGPKGENGSPIHSWGLTLHPELDTLEVRSNGDHVITYAKNGMVLTVGPRWLYWTEEIRAQRKTVLEKGQTKPTVIPAD